MSVCCVSASILSTWPLRAFTWTISRLNRLRRPSQERKSELRAFRFRAAASVQQSSVLTTLVLNSFRIQRQYFEKEAAAGRLQPWVPPVPEVPKTMLETVGLPQYTATYKQDAELSMATTMSKSMWTSNPGYIMRDGAHMASSTHQDYVWDEQAVSITAQNAKVLDLARQHVTACQALNTPCFLKQVRQAVSRSAQQKHAACSNSGSCVSCSLHKVPTAVRSSTHLARAEQGLEHSRPYANLLSAADACSCLSSLLQTHVPTLHCSSCLQIEFMKQQGEFNKQHNKRRDEFVMYVEAAAKAHHQLGSRPSAAAAAKK